MPTLKLTLEYDGTDFSGWQVQPGARTVQEEVEAALATLQGKPIRVVASGRTDAGVHAAGQVISFQVERVLPLGAYVQGMNSLLPPDVAVLAAEVAPEGFDARRWASGKRYVYRILNRGIRSPLARRSHWELFSPLDREAMREAARQLLGEHDFASFQGANCAAQTTVRRLWRLDVGGEGHELVLTFEATAFLKHMVRNLVGTLVEVGQGKREAGAMAELLEARDRRLAGVTAPPQGLCLEEVFYERRMPGKDLP